jgi:hypothetical protein
MTQFADHLYQCSSRTEQCPRCNKFIQIRDYEHHVEQVDCLGVKNAFQEHLDRISNEVYANFEGDPAEVEAEILRRVAEEQDREYAEELYKKLMMERTPSQSEENEDRRNRPETGYREAVVESVEEIEPRVERNNSEGVWGGITEEEQMINEAIMKSFQDR